MVDVEAFRQHLAGGSPLRMIDFGDTIPADVMDYLRQLEVGQVMSLFALYPHNEKARRTREEGKYVNLEVRCPECRKTTTIGASQKTVIEYYRNPRKFVCEECRAKQELPVQARQEKAPAEKERREEDAKYGNGRTVAFKKSRLNPMADVFLANFITAPIADISDIKESGYLRRQMFDYFDMFCRILTDGDNAIIQEHIKSMPYDRFLQTLYWQLISQRVKEAANYKCALDHSGSNLVAHHTNYGIHGLEHIYWKTELICLCQRCHEKFHDINSKF